MVNFQITTNIDQWTKNFNKRAKELERKGINTPKQVADWAKVRSKALAPKNSGTLMHAIDSKRVGSNRKGEGVAMVYVKKMNNPRWRGKYASVPRYARIQHELPVGKSFFNYRRVMNGDPHWLFTVRKQASKMFKKRLLGHLQTFK
jgi:hypothetical protein